MTAIKVYSCLIKCVIKSLNNIVINHMLIILSENFSRISESIIGKSDSQRETDN